MGEARKFKPFWNLDQALIWIATRDGELTIAAQVLNGPDAFTWMRWQIQVDANEGHFVKPPPEIEEEILDAIRAEDLNAHLQEGGTVRPSWLFGAKILNEGSSYQSYIQGRSQSSPTHDSQLGRPTRKIYPIFRTQDVVGLWPIAETAEEAVEEAIVTYRTGAPGRPSSKTLWFAEAIRRMEADDFGSSLKSFAEELSLWLAEKHPEAASTKPKTIENGIRDLRQRNLAKRSQR